MVSITAYIFIIRRTHKKSTSNIGNKNIHKYKVTKKEEEENERGNETAVTVHETE